MKIFNSLALLSASAMTLTACGGGSTTDTVTKAARYAALDAGSAARALDDGKQLAAVNASAITIDWNENEATSADGAFSIRKTQDGQFAFTANGREYVFTADDLDGDCCFRIRDDVNNIYVDLGSYDGPITEDLDVSDGRYAQVFSWYADADNTGIAGRGVFVIGTETEAAQLDLLTSAGYRGWSNLRFAPATGYTGGDSEVKVRGNTTLAADFTSGTISGGIGTGELRLENPGADDTFIDGSVSYDAALIDGTTFGGTVSVDDAFVTNVGVGDVSGDYEGSFYGPFADEAAGTITGTGSDGFILYGQFNTEKQD